MRWSIMWVLLATLRAATAFAFATGDDPGGRHVPKTSSFPPPDAEDTVFSATGGMLHRYLSHSAGPIQIPIQIKRYFGTAAERSAQQHRGLLPEYVYLLMPAFDVDVVTSVSGIQPECDNVYFNGKFVDSLDGNDNIWLLNIMRVKLSDICFPEAPGEVGENMVLVDIDVLNSRDVWLVEIDWAVLLIPAARPIIFVHGLWSSQETWEAIARVLSSAYGLPGVAINLGADLSIEANAAILNNKINTLLRLYGVEQFNLVAHSKGGLDARCYSSNGGCGVDGKSIYTIMQIATPNAGSNLANVALNGEGLTWYEWEMYKTINARLELSCGALRSLTPEAMRLFNRNCPSSFSNAPIHVLAGWANQVEKSNYVKFGLSLPKLAYNYDGVSQSEHRNGDAIVSVASAQYDIDPVPQSPMHDPNATHCEIIEKIGMWSLMAFDAWLAEIKYPAYILTSGGSGSKGLLVESTATVSQPPIGAAPCAAGDDDLAGLSSFSNSTEFGGVLYPGEIRDFQFGVTDSQRVALAVLGLPPEVQGTLMVPDGRVLSSADEPPTFMFHSDEDAVEGQELDSFHRLWTDSFGLVLTNPPRGNYVFRVDGSALAVPCTFACIVQEETSDLTLRGGLVAQNLQIGDRLVYRCRIEAGDRPLPPGNPALRLRVVSREGTEVSADFSPVAGGGGANVADYQAELSSLPAGEHQVFVELTHTFPDGVQTNRRLSDVAVVSRTVARLLDECEFRPVDRDGNGSCEFLEADIHLETDHAGTYFYRGVWRDDANQLLATYRSPPVTLTAGRHTCTLAIAVKDIFEICTDGPAASKSGCFV